jgi:hypothetical protein
MVKLEEIFLLYIYRAHNLCMENAFPPTHTEAYLYGRGEIDRAV